MNISFDPAKTERNERERGLSFLLVDDWDWSCAVIEYFKAAGDGWQTRIDHALKQFIAEHPCAS